jgi:hypothetical protein
VNFQNARCNNKNEKNNYWLIHVRIFYKFLEHYTPGNLRAFPGLYWLALATDFVNVKSIRPCTEILNTIFF